LIRSYGEKETMGTYLVYNGMNKVFQCVCLELPWINNQHDISCIPSGTYPVIKYSYEGHPDVFWIQNVPNRQGIMIHIGNFASGMKVDTKGCLLPGMNFVDINGDGNMDVMAPDIAMDALNHFLPNSFNIIII
jgi:hypothetical protein